MQSAVQRESKSTACRAADLRAEPGVPLSVELGDGDEGLQALAAADQAPLVHIQHLDREGLLVLHHTPQGMKKTALTLTAEASP